LITIDFETYYASDYSLTKVTTEEYVRDPRFQVIGVSVKVNDAPAEWFTGDMEETAEWLAGFDWGNHFVLAHNAMFDAAILTWVFGQKPKAWLDTLSMARAILGTQVGGSLAKLVEHFGLGVKGTEVVDAKGLRREDFGAEQLAQYGEYCKNDVELTYKLYHELNPTFPVKEKRLIDITIRMFSDPLLELDTQKLEDHLVAVRERKAKLFTDAGITKEILNSSAKFAELLGQYVQPPMKPSPANPEKFIYAFAKSDEHFVALLDHYSEAVQAIVAARLGAKSTLEETRTERFINISRRGHICGSLNRLPIPLKYYAAHTGRWGGADKINLQNLPSRGAEGGKLKRCIVAPRGYVIIDCDSSQIEARVLAWLAGETYLLDLFRQKADVYKHMASSIYVTPEHEITADQRFIGKTTVLGAGYGMGATKFQAQLANMGKNLSFDDCAYIIKGYRGVNRRIANWWNHLTMILQFMLANKPAQVDAVGLMETTPFTGIQLPNGLFLNYPGLHKDSAGQFVYETRSGLNKIYGGKVAENLCQAVARCVIGEQIVQIEKRYRVVLTVHDAVACVVPEDEADEARAYIEECMRTSPPWALDLPLNCESGMARNYGDC
jgi:DNA polymerase I-like protein with 3'-5' exonuclease and polymerase domains